LILFVILSLEVDVSDSEGGANHAFTE